MATEAPAFGFRDHIAMIYGPDETAPAWRRRVHPRALPVGSTAAVLARGPSLLETWKGGADLVVAVNHAINLYPADWLVSWDEVAEGIHRTPRVGVATMGEKNASVLGVERLNAQQFAPLAMWQAVAQFSIFGAISLAAWLGADRIVLHGDDKEGHRYADSPFGRNNTPQRWGREAAIQDELVRYLADHGVTVDHA